MHGIVNSALILNGGGSCLRFKQTPDPGPSDAGSGGACVMSDRFRSGRRTEMIMFQELLASLVSLLIVDPLQAEMSERLAQARAPQAVIAQVRACAEASLPGLADRAMAEPLWVVTTALNVWTGQTAPESILGSTPQCESALKSARVYLESRGA